MCGIVGAIADRDVVPVLVEGLKRLEYRGYDSAGIAVAGIVLVAALVLLGVILTIYGGNQLSAVIVLSSLENVVSMEMAAMIGLALATIVLASALVLFSRKVSS